MPHRTSRIWRAQGDERLYVAVSPGIPYLEHVKAFLTIAVLLFYTVSAAGVQFYVHTCGGVTTVDPLPATAEDPCGCDEGMDQAPCCTSQFVSADLDDGQPALKVTVAGAGNPTLISPVAVAQDQKPAGFALLLRSTANAPPFRVSPTILFCTFLI